MMSKQLPQNNQVKNLGLSSEVENTNAGINEIEQQSTTSHHRLHKNSSNALKPSLRFMFSHPVHIVSLGFGTGLSAIAPGTMGTLFAWFSFVILNRYFSPGGWALLILAGFVLGAVAVGYTAKKLGVEDPGGANLDEIVAFWLVLLFIMPASFTMQLMAFLLFRFFDIVKPQPIRYVEQRFSGGFGIMFDDLVAAFFTLLVIAAWQALRSALSYS